MEILPPAAQSDKNDGHSKRPSTNYYSVGTLHYHGNDLTELRKIAEVSPELAEKLIDHRDKQDARENTSFRLGFVGTIMLVAFAIASLTFMIVTVGVVATLCAIVGIIAIALLVRVILTGEWSDTSWFGKAVTSLVTLLGGKPEPTDSEEK